MAKKSKAPKELSPNVGEGPIMFEYIKSAAFRVIHADGAVGSVTPNGNVHMAFFSERPAIPRAMVHKRNPDGSLGEAIKEQTVARIGVVREMDVDVVMSESTVDALITWLTDQKQKLQARNALAQQILRARKVGKR